MNPENPYTPVLIDPTHENESLVLSPDDQEKAEIVIRDSRFFFLALIFISFCQILALFFIMPWYYIRLAQWNDLAKRYPSLLCKNPTPRSISDRFQRSKRKLWACLIVGLGWVIVLLGIIVFFLVTADYRGIRGPSPLRNAIYKMDEQSDASKPDLLGFGSR